MKFNNNSKKTLLLAMMFASMMNSTAFASSFTDINNIQGREYIEKFVEKGYIKGYEYNIFRPNNTITRAEISQILSSFNISLKFEEISFSDSNGWFYNAIKKLLKMAF